MKSQRILPAAVLLCTLAAACGEPPTGTDAQARPGGASYETGGFGMGSGRTSGESEGSTVGEENETEDSGGFGMGSGREGTMDGPSTTTIAEDSAGRSGGFGMGSGR